MIYIFKVVSKITAFYIKSKDIRITEINVQLLNRNIHQHTRLTNYFSSENNQPTLKSTLCYFLLHCQGQTRHPFGTKDTADGPARRGQPKQKHETTRI
jgi:hypothetical protein